MDKLLVWEGFIKSVLMLMFLLLSATAIYFYETKKRDWQVEAEGIVKQGLPVGTSRARVAKWLALGPHYTRDSKPRVIHIYIWSSQLLHQPSHLNDTVVVDVYFDSSQKVSGYGSAYPTRVTWT